MQKRQTYRIKEAIFDVPEVATSKSPVVLTRAAYYTVLIQKRMTKC